MFSRLFGVLNDAQSRHRPVGFRLFYLQSLHKPSVLLRRDLPHLDVRPRPLVHALFQALVQQDEPVTLNYNRASMDLSISKREYLAVELAVKLNESSGPWSNKILFEGQPKQTPQLISLNAFVVSMRSFLFYLQQYGIIPQNWENYCELTECIGILQESMNVIWQAVQNQWPDLFCSDSEKRRIIQGSIGFSSINKYLIQQLKSKSGPIGITEFLLNAIAWIQSIRLPSAVWLPGGRFSKLSSATGYSIIA